MGRHNLSLQCYCYLVRQDSVNCAQPDPKRTVLGHSWARPGPCPLPIAAPSSQAGLEGAKVTEGPKAPKNPTSSRGLFNTNMGPLQRQLRLGEYNLLKCAAMFESDFVQVSKQGGILDVHNQVQQVRVAIAATSPGLPVPDVLLLARPVLLPQQLPPNLQQRYRPRTRNRKFELTRLLPLCFVKITIHDQEKKQLRFKMVTGRTFYLQLCPPADNQKDNFDLWIKVVHLLRPRSDINQDKWRQDPWKSGDLAPQATISSATQASEEREISIAEVLSTLQEEILDSPGNTMDFLDTPSVSTSPTPTLMAIQERLESPFPLEAHSSMEEPWSVPQERKENPMALLPISRYETRDAPKETQEVAHGAGGQRKSKTRSKSSRSRRSHSSKRVVSQASRKISSFVGSLSGSSQKVPKSSRSSRKPSTSKERKR
ncbi:Golgi-associated RAB2 interactor protein 2-like [Ahaetulla prasina]|uniref:Golgi-associated RAB2 interactor protein 2-like n=1 Tax=Ahaetulla prasina TaxID=499056 RepID=UPI002649D63B|nr:Golgi-associated RAB2 interactor protein 2-like [Ahaetulla prasina]